jgi:hypothetical protein
MSKRKGEPVEKCDSKLRNKDKTCRQTAGNRTDHPGVGRCWLHGGLNQKIDLTDPKNRYLIMKQGRIRDLIEAFAEDTNPLDLSHEVMVLRALLLDLMERWESIYGVDGALLAWHESFHTGDGPPKPRQLPDFSSVSSVADRVGAMVDRIVKHKAEGAITMATLSKLLEKFGVETAQAVSEMKLEPESEAKLLTDIETRWNNVRL